MAKWAVSFVSFSDNDLKTVIVEAPSWKAALSQHPNVTDFHLEGVSDDQVQAQSQFFDQDCLFDAVRAGAS